MSAKLVSEQDTKKIFEVLRQNSDNNIFEGFTEKEVAEMALLFKIFKF
jgi:hypothetical protein